MTPLDAPASNEILRLRLRMTNGEQLRTTALLSLPRAYRRSNLGVEGCKEVVRGFSLVQWSNGTTLKGRTTVVIGTQL